MIEMKEHLTAQAFKARTEAGRKEGEVLQKQRDIAILRADAGQLRAYAAECERVIATVYGDQPQPAEQEQAQPETLPAPSHEEVARNMQAYKDAGQEPDKVTLLDHIGGEQYNQLSAQQKSYYGSRRNYVIAMAQSLDAQELMHGQHSASKAPPDNVVWLTSQQATVEQMRFSSDQKEIDGLVHYAINVQMLTPEQRAELGLA